MYFLKFINVHKMLDIFVSII